MTPSTFLTAGEASRLTGKSIPTITRNVKNGKIANSRRGDDGDYEIDPVALSNRYPFIDQVLGGKGNDTPDMLGDVTPRLDPALQAIVDANKLTIEQLEARIEEKDELIGDYKTRLRETKALTDQRSPEEKARDAQAVADAQRLQDELKQAQLDIDLTPKIKKRRLSWKERVFGAEILEAEEVA